jgi:hypothetical protein
MKIVKKQGGCRYLKVISASTCTPLPRVNIKVVKSPFIIKFKLIENDKFNHSIDIIILLLTCGVKLFFNSEVQHEKIFS